MDQQGLFRKPFRGYRRPWDDGLANAAALSGYDLAIQADPRLAAAYVRRGEVQGIRQELDKAPLPTIARRLSSNHLSKRARGP